MSFQDPGEGRLIIVSNRLPFTVHIDKDDIRFDESTGGLVTGISTFLDSYDSYKYHLPRLDKHIWLGWPGNPVPEALKDRVRSRALSECGSYPVFLSQLDMEQFYWGFCNKTIWPLFHYFPTHVCYEEGFWKRYRRVNELFCDAVMEFLEPQDFVWVHDYHLMLLPRLLKEKAPQNLIGFFLHIPFPSFELFRLLPPNWRRDLLAGILGADLVGFHTYEYKQHFFQAVLRILGYEHHISHITLPDHIVRVETFPMGIDFQKFFKTSTAPETLKERAHYKLTLSGMRTVLSVDRLDYSKGILNRLHGFELLLETYPEYRGKLVLIMVVVPSRIGVMEYELMKKQIEESVGRINGRFGSIGWTPVLYQYRYLTIHPLSAFYGLSDVALVTPLRDGMNLIAKEYIVSRTDRTGVLILSEMAGAAKELGEAIIVNPNDRREIAEALRQSLEMPIEEQERRNTIMQERLKRYDVVRWATDFIQHLGQMRRIQEQYSANLMAAPLREQIVEEYVRSNMRLIFIDYDGTLAPYERRPNLAVPSRAVLDLLGTLASDRSNALVLISGRDQPTLEQWFGKLPIGLSAEHGMWLRESGSGWRTIGPYNRSWKSSVMALLTQYSDRLPGSFVEEKEFSLAWHYRGADPDQSRMISTELLDNLVHLTANMDIQVLQGNKVLEVRNAGVNKGRAAIHWLSKAKYDFILAIGDDQTDEDIFQILPAEAYSMRVGITKTHARFNLRHAEDARGFLGMLINTRTGYA